MDYFNYDMFFSCTIYDYWCNIHRRWMENSRLYIYYIRYNPYDNTMAQIKNKDKYQGLFKDLFISANERDKIIRIGIYDQGYETFDLEEIIELRSYLNKIIIKLKFEK